MRDYYASYMDQAARDAAGIKPLQPLLDKIAGIDSIAKLTAAFGSADIDGSNSPVGIGLTSALFAFAHDNNPEVSNFALLNTFLAGIWFAFFRT